MDNNNIEEEKKVVNIEINPDTGEHMIINTDTEYNSEDNKFENMVKKINEGDMLDNKPLNEEEILNMLGATDDESVLNVLGNDTGLSAEDVKQILNIVNRRISGEKFNVYKSLPDSVQGSINQYILGDSSGFIQNSNVNYVRNSIAESIIDEFISDIQINRSKNDFAMELEKIYKDANKDIADASLEYIEDRNKAYRDSLDSIEDEYKRDKLKSILDRIDDARDLTELKEFAKTCRIKCIEIEKANSRVFSVFLNKYKNSSNNIYDINLAGKVLYRNMKDDYGYAERHIIAFLVLFCKYVSNFSVDNPLDHAFMYYVLYYCAMLDADKSKKFKDNVSEVIENIKVRNSYIG